ncbi:MAG: branched-chain amino acid transaminase [Candidatus Woesearchaeota archaeon]|jgi:branched-chain amino acid aminotransferase|nr:branched-chain amino acid transaminase [Candidatus Woesearchaeota archaeon]
MKETKLIWMDGKLVPWKDANVHVLTHTLHYGAGVFEGIRCYETDKGAAIFKLNEHIDRLFYSAESVDMKIPFSNKEIVKATIQTVKENDLKAGYIRPICFFGYGKMGLNPKSAPVNTSIAVWPWGSYLGDQAVKVKTSKYIRIHPKSAVSDAKIVGFYANSILASIEVKNAGYDEALLLDYEGNVAEGPGENIFIVKDNKILTPQAGSILPGITRASVKQLAKDLNIEVEEKELKLEDIYDADEAFFTGTAAEVTSIESLDNKKIGNAAPGPITTKIKELFMDIVHGKNEKYNNWLTYVNE